jgi:hypothetical protein
MSVAKHWYMRDKANVVEIDVTVRKPEVTNLARIGKFICLQQILIVQACFDCIVVLQAVALLRAMLTSKTALTDVFIGSLEEPPAVPSLKVVRKQAVRMCSQ